MGFLHFVPPFRDAVEVALLIYPILAYCSTPHLLCVLYFLYLHSREARWQLIPVYVAVFITIIFPYFLNGVFLSVYCIIALTLTYQVPMSGSLTSQKAHVGVQDVCFEGEKTDFWVRFYYPALPTKNRISLVSFVEYVVPLFVTSGVAISMFNDIAAILAYLALSSIVCYEKLVDSCTSRIAYLPHGMTHANIAEYAQLPSFLFAHMNLMTTTAMPDAPWAGDSSAPIALLLHGLGACRSTYTSIAYSLVEAGHIVVCPEFGDGTPCYTSLPSGECRPYQSFDGGESGPAYHAFRADQLLHRGIEVQLILKYLKELSAGNAGSFIKQVQWSSKGKSTFLSSLQGSSTSILLCGHSFGGATAVHLATSPSCRDLRAQHSIEGVILLDPWMFPLSQELYDGKQVLEYPTLCLHADRFQWKENLDFETRVLQACTTMVVQAKIQNCGHVSYCEMALLAPYVSAYLLKNTGVRDPWTCLQQICGVVSAFAASNPKNGKEWHDNLCNSLRTKDFRILYARSTGC